MTKDEIRWREFLKNNIIETAASVFGLVIMLILYANFLTYVESRDGFSFADPILKLFAPVDLTWLTFGLIYFSIIAGLLYFARLPKRLLFILQLYTLIIIVRIIAMFLLPLNPPESMILLIDPLVEFFGTGKTLTKDLFFSGHTATLYMLYLVSEGRIRYYFLAATFLVAASVLLQHVHYTIDVAASIFFVYALYKFFSAARQRMG